MSTRDERHVLRMTAEEFADGKADGLGDIEIAGNDVGR